MGCLCDHHRRMMVSCPVTAKRFWGRSILYARNKIANHDAYTAMLIYRNALEVADILLDTDTDSRRAQIRYSRTAVELAYILRKYDQQRQITDLLFRMRARLRLLPLDYTEQELIQGVEDAAEVDKTAINLWLENLAVRSTRGPRGRRYNEMVQARSSHAPHNGHVSKDSMFNRSSSNASNEGSALPDNVVALH